MDLLVDDVEISDCAVVGGIGLVFKRRHANFIFVLADLGFGDLEFDGQLLELIRIDMFGLDDLPLAQELDGKVLEFASNQAQDLRSQWEGIQAGFVDEPKQAVERADELVANTIKRLAEVFASERNKLESAWGKNEDVSTEDLRVALRRYRSFFNRLLSV